jgi:hypothetical protein
MGNQTIPTISCAGGGLSKDDGVVIDATIFDCIS